jgi:glycosyltransferase involved in cell wall biosynthesis
VKLAIVSHTPHYRVGDAGAPAAERSPGGAPLCGWGATVREIDWLATLFDRIVHVAPLHPGPPPREALPYRAANVRVLPVAPSGGRSPLARAGLVAAAPSYLRAIRSALEGTDAVHVRLPSNIGALAVVALAVREAPAARWYKYAGNWLPHRHEPLSFRLQRWLLRHARTPAVVTVNGDWPRQPDHVVPFLNPCLSQTELAVAARAAARKPPAPPARLLLVGRLERKKGVREAADVVRRLIEEGIDLRFDVVGDGPGGADLTALRATAPERVRLHGWMPRAELDRLYEAAHLLLHPTHTEGWPKVIGEAMAHGAVPVTTDVSTLAPILARGGTGTVVEIGDVAALATAVRAYLTDADLLRRHAGAAVRLAAEFTYERFLDRLRDLFDERWGLTLPPVAASAPRGEARR